MSARRASQAYLVPGAAGLVGAIAVEDERRLLLEGVEHLSHGVRQTHHCRLHDDGRLAGSLHVARGHGGARTLVRREDVLELRAVDERLVEMRVLARRVAEDVPDPRGDELLREALRAGSFDELDSIRALCASRGHERLENGSGRREREARGGKSLEKTASRDRARQELRHQLSHWGFLRYTKAR